MGINMSFPALGDLREQIFLPLPRGRVLEEGIEDGAHTMIRLLHDVRGDPAPLPSTVEFSQEYMMLLMYVCEYWKREKLGRNPILHSP